MTSRRKGLRKCKKEETNDLRKQESENLRKDFLRMFQAQKTRLLLLKEQSRVQIIRAYEAAICTTSPSMFNLKLHDAKDVSEYVKSEDVRSEDVALPSSSHDESMVIQTQKSLVPPSGRFKTPAHNPLMQYAITPKVNPSIPMGMLRLPKQGEFAVSATGSPLLVSTSSRDETANINIPLTDGRKMVILPLGHVNTESIRCNLDEDVRRQLENLKSTIHGILDNVEV